MNVVILIYFEIQLQNDHGDDVDDVGNTDAVKDENKEDGNKSSGAGLVVAIILLVFSIMVFGGAVWWSYGNGSQCPSILRGYEPVAESDTNYLMSEFSTSTQIP